MAFTKSIRLSFGKQKDMCKKMTVTKIINSPTSNQTQKLDICILSSVIILKIAHSIQNLRLCE